MDENQYPLVTIKSSKISGLLPNLKADLAITLKGVTKVISVPMAITKNAANIHIRGQAQLLQSDFGITPFSILGGAIAVQDQLTINFNIVTKSQ